MAWTPYDAARLGLLMAMDTMSEHDMTVFFSVGVDPCGPVDGNGFTPLVSVT